MPSLIVRSRNGSTLNVDLSARPLRFGRADTCDVVLRNDGEVSREHAEIWIDEEGRVVVADRNSKNGTRVDDGEIFRNDRRVAFQRIRLGEHEIEVLDAAPRPAPGGSVKFAVDPETRMGDTRFFPPSKRPDLNAQRLGLLIGLTERIGGAFERKQLLEQALDACCDALGFERGLIVLKTPRGEPEHPVTRNVPRDASGAFMISRTLINRALIHGERAVVNNPATDFAGNLSESMVRFPICSALCVPILHRDEILGAVYGDRVTQASTYKPSDVDFLATIAQQVGVGLANLRLLREHVRSQKVYAELEQARQIQLRLLPSAPLHMSLVTAEGYNCASSAVGGDYFDYFNLGEGRMGFVIADVTGHGLPASIVMANLQAAIHVALLGKNPLPELVARVNRLIYRNTSAHVFVTAIIGVVDTQTGLVEYVSAGHPAPLLFEAGGIRIPDDENALPLGVDPDETFIVRTVHPSSRARAMLLYTDGLIEAASPDGSMLGLPAVVDRLSTIDDYSTGAVIQAALAILGGHLRAQKNYDDMTLLALQFDDPKPR